MQVLPRHTAQNGLVHPPKPTAAPTEVAWVLACRVSVGVPSSGKGPVLVDGCIKSSVRGVYIGVGWQHRGPCPTHVPPPHPLQPALLALACGLV